MDTSACPKTRTNFSDQSLNSSNSASHYSMMPWSMVRSELILLSTSTRWLRRIQTHKPINFAVRSSKLIRQANFPRSSSRSIVRHASVGPCLDASQVNVILWPGLLEQFRKEALGAALLAVYGVWQAEGKVRHLIASKLVDRTELLGALPTTAREFR